VSVSLAMTLPPFPGPVTAVAWAPARCVGSGTSATAADGAAAGLLLLLAVGLETGAVQVWRVQLAPAAAAATAQQVVAPGCTSGALDPTSTEQGACVGPSVDVVRGDGMSNVQSATCVWATDSYNGCAGQVSSLAWRDGLLALPARGNVSLGHNAPNHRQGGPLPIPEPALALQLACGSDDHSVRVFEFQL
jgi:hypothetical protein